MVIPGYLPSLHIGISSFQASAIATPQKLSTVALATHFLAQTRVLVIYKVRNCSRLLSILSSSPTEITSQQKSTVAQDFPSYSMGPMKGKGDETKPPVLEQENPPIHDQENPPIPKLSKFEIPPILNQEITTLKNSAPKKSDISPGLWSMPYCQLLRAEGSHLWICPFTP